MQPGEIKIKKQHEAEKTGMSRPCGTMAYMAQCRGQIQNVTTSWRPKPPDSISGFIRKNPAG